MNPEIEEANTASRSAMRAVAERLSEDEMVRPIEGPWSASAVFAHLAFWDRFCRARWLHAEKAGLPTPIPLDDAVLELINDADLPHWADVPARTAVEESLEAAENVDALIEGLDDDIGLKIEAEGRRRLIDRSIHRREHLMMVEARFPTGG
jgi:hypothetical protein